MFQNYSACCCFLYPDWIFLSLCGSKSFCFLLVQGGKPKHKLSFPQPCFALLPFSHSWEEFANLRWQRSVWENFWQICGVRIVKKLKGLEKTGGPLDLEETGEKNKQK